MAARRVPLECRLPSEFTRRCVVRAFQRGCSVVELAELTNWSCEDIEAVLRDAMKGST